MKKIINAEPASYPITNTAEYKSVFTFLNIIDKNYIKADLRILDKYPNTDGIIELVTVEQRPIGKLDIQIKTLNENHKDNPKYQCNIEFLAYCEESLLPVILVVVDAESEKAYWIYLCRDLLIKLNSELNGKSINVSIPIDNIISKTELKYLKEWEGIVKSRLTRLIDYDSIKKELKEYEQKYIKLQSLVNPALGIEKEIFKEIHLFLDYYNNLLENEFNVIKEIFYPEHWKIGLAYSEYTDNRLSYSMYPITYTQNDIQIKELDLIKAYKDRSVINYARFGLENPIKRNPVEHAYTYIIKDLVKIIDNNALLPLNEFVAHEYIIGFIDNYYEIFGLEKDQDRYSLEDLNKAIPGFLSLFIEEYLKQPKSFDISKVIQVDLDSFNLHILPKKREIAFKTAKERWIKGEQSKHRYAFQSKKWNFKYLDNLINYLEKNNIPFVHRLFDIKNFPQGRPYFRWETYTREQAKTIITKIYSELPILYDNFIDEYFSKIKDKIKFFSNFNRLIINIKFNESTIYPAISPSEERIYLKNISNPEEKRLDVFLIGVDNPPITWQSLLKDTQTEYIIDNNNYNFITASTGELDKIYETTPMKNYIYEVLRNRLEDYLKPYKKGSSRIFKSSKY